MQREKVKLYSTYVRYAQDSNLKVTLRAVHGQCDYAEQLTLERFHVANDLPNLARGGEHSTIQDGLPVT